MCGRFTLTIDPAQLMARFALENADFVAQPRFNIAPTQTIAVVFDESPRTLSGARWGLVPSWAKDIAIGSKMINARAETLDEKPSFRTLLRRRRCLVLADSFYEWRKNPDETKTPLRILLRDGAPFAMAGLWDIWKTPQGESLRTCTIRSAWSTKACFQRARLIIVSRSPSQIEQVQLAAVRPPRCMASKTSRLQRETTRPSTTIEEACRACASMGRRSG